MNYWGTEQYRADVRASVDRVIGYRELRGKHILVTGASGLVGSFVMDLLLELGAKAIPAGRNPEYLSERFRTTGLFYDMRRVPEFSFSPDMIIHAAGYGHPNAFHTDPVGTIKDILWSTENLLAFGRRCGVGKFIMISTGEVQGKVNYMNPRSCYPAGKQAAEALCAAYLAQYGLPALTARLCHTYGPGFSSKDDRIATQLFRSAWAHEKLVLKSRGEQLRSWCYVADAGTALLTLLMHGDAGMAYEIANTDSVCTIAEFAGLIAEKSGLPLSVEKADETEREKRSPIPMQVLNTTKLERLGWRGCYALKQGIHAMLAIGKELSTAN